MSEKNKEAHVVVKDVSKVYRGGSSDGTADVYALRDIQLEIPYGQFLAVMGASGSGKSTLLHLMAGLTVPTFGSIFIAGKNISTLSDYDLTTFRRDHIGVVFQAFNLIPTLTAEENIMLPVLAGGNAVKTSSDKMKSAMETLLTRLNLQDRRHHRPDSLSGGEQQRVALARALFADFAEIQGGMENSGLLLADEPTGNLDSTNSEIICKLLREFCDERRHTMVVVTHEVSVAKWADRVISLRDGKIISDVPASELKEG
ncbi:MAG: ABC transporter ATP-binding protein [Planctomycetia bacterium]|nr:ABC transporter ATP-binding protein [Planctomycetia bacterium]